MNSIQQRLTTALGQSYRVERELGAGGMATFNSPERAMKAGSAV
ncbi:hypothetical protein [Gemmatimonas sp.]